MKRYYYILSVLCAFLLGSCSEDDILGIGTLTREQKELLGTAVNFNPSMAEDFVETRYTQNHEGGFNEGDIMQIYRQYWDANQNKWEDLQAFRTYRRDVTYAAGTSISLRTDWKVCVGRQKCDDWNPATKSGTFYTQTKADSLTWDNGATVRFRAWSRSNVTDCLSNGSAGSYYPDFCIADWVTVSGPTSGIPLTLRHVCSRIVFSVKSGNQFYNGEICLDPADYQWNDNADSHPRDEDDKLSADEAQQIVDKVKAVYNRMCLPAGVDIEDGTLKTMTTDLYNSMATDNKQDPLYHSFSRIEQMTKDQGIVDYGEKTPDEIANDIKHPTFSNVDGRLYMMTIPYDMSNESQTQGDVLILPAKTRFKIRLRDVNNGDSNTTGYEYKEHIFSLSDIKSGKKDAEGKDIPMYPNGLPLTPGKSYRFTVGYLYDQLTVTVIEEGIDWTTGPAEEGNAENQQVAEVTDTPYGWWKGAINTAITEAMEGNDYNPIFEISTPEQFKEFIALVNGTAAIKTSGLERKLRDIPNPDADPVYDNDGTSKYWWYDVEQTLKNEQDGYVDADGNPVIAWVSREEAEAQGYIFYRQYIPQITDRLAYSIENYIRGPISFYDDQVDLHLVVKLTNDIDFCDWELQSVGIDEEHPFMGFFDGGTHTLSNVNMRTLTDARNQELGNYLFGHMEDGEIRNLLITSTHPLGLLYSGTTSSSIRNLRLVGISLKTDCEHSPIAQSLTGGGTAYVVGCIHEGDAGGALVGTADNLTMLGCMHATSNLHGAALLGSYAPGAPAFFAPQAGPLEWKNFHCNYYERSFGQGTYAVGGATVDRYRPQEYIRGARPGILRAKEDNLVSEEVEFDKLDDQKQEEFYGLAPWKAMNYAIWKYNLSSVATTPEYGYHPESHQCGLIYQVDNTGYQHLYPQLVPGAATNEGVRNILYLNN